MRVRLRANGKRIVLKAGMAALWGGVRDRGSIAAAAHVLGTRDCPACSLVGAMTLDFPALAADVRHGGTGHRGAARSGVTLTLLGAGLLAAWQALARVPARAAADHVAGLVPLIASEGGQPAASPAA